MQKCECEEVLKGKVQMLIADKDEKCCINAPLLLLMLSQTLPYTQRPQIITSAVFPCILPVQHPYIRILPKATNGRSDCNACIAGHKRGRPIVSYLSYRIGIVGTGCCLYAHIYIHNIIYDTITLRITSTSGSQKWCFKVIQNILVRSKLI